MTIDPWLELPARFRPSTNKYDDVDIFEDFTRLCQPYDDTADILEDFMRLCQP